MGSVFLRNDIGMISEFLPAKMERVLASLRVQSYNTKERIPNFFANLWHFKMLKSAHFPSVYWKKIIFHITRVYRFQNVIWRKIKFLFGSPFPWLPVRISIHLRLASDDSPFVLRSIFDRRTELERRLNGGSTEDERRMNGGWTEVERSSNGGWTEDERSSNGGWTELERRLNGARTEVERSSNGGWTELERRMNGGRTEVERSSNGGWTEDERRTIRKIYHRNCWANCDAVSLLMIFRKLIIVNFKGVFLDNILYKTLQNIRHIKILLPNAEHSQTYYLKTISLQPYENQTESNTKKKKQN